MQISKKAYHDLVQNELRAMVVVDSLKAHIGKVTLNIKEIAHENLKNISNDQQTKRLRIALEWGTFFLTCEKLIKDFDKAKGGEKIYEQEYNHARKNRCIRSRKQNT